MVCVWRENQEINHHIFFIKMLHCLFCCVHSKPNAVRLFRQNGEVVGVVLRVSTNLTMLHISGGFEAEIVACELRRVDRTNAISQLLHDCKVALCNLQLNRNGQRGT